MSSTEDLLKLSTRGAIVRMVNDENHTFFDGGISGPLLISAPLTVDGIRTEVEISVRRRLSGNDQLPYPGQLAFRYNRLDVEHTLAGKLNGFRPAMPTSTRVVLDELTRRTGIVFENDDFVLEDIIRNNAAPYVLKAKVESLRWVGELPVTLIDLTELSSYIPGGLPSGGVSQLVLKGPAINTKDNQPYLNASSTRAELSGLLLNSPVTAVSHPLAVWIAKVVGQLGGYLRDLPSPWNVTTTAAPYNLRNAELISKDETITGLNPLVPAATKVARVRLSALDSTYGAKDLLIPYAPLSFNTSEFNNMPRLKSSAVVNASNGTPWNKWLNSLTAPSVITSLPDGMDLRISGPDRWVADANTPSPTNLFNAVIQYNGARRAYDIKPYYEECNRVLAFTVSDKNTGYQGNMVFHYRAPIMINEVMPDAVVGSPYDHDLAPSEGVAPYVITRVSGALAPNHSLMGTHVGGPTAAAGRFAVVYDVTDAEGTKVRYNLSYRAIIADINIAGNPPPASIGYSYTFEFTVTGGVPTYTYSLTELGGSTGLHLVSPFSPQVTGTITGSPGTRSYVLEVTDSQGTVTTRNFTLVVN